MEVSKIEAAVAKAKAEQAKKITALETVARDENKVAEAITTHATSWDNAIKLGWSVKELTGFGLSKPLTPTVKPARAASQPNPGQAQPEGAYHATV